MSFQTALPEVLIHEGGYVNDPLDAGGETFRGISRRANPDWPGWPIIDAAKLAGIRTAAAINRHYANNSVIFDLVAALYRRKYYLPVAKFPAPERATDKMFDAGVHRGPGGAIRIAQGVLGVKADGVIGPKTLAAAHGYFSLPRGEDAFLTAFRMAQAAFYRAIVDRKPNQAKFLSGWLARAAWMPK
jgi:lysozyme family protein